MRNQLDHNWCFLIPKTKYESWKDLHRSKLSKLVLHGSLGVVIAADMEHSHSIQQLTAFSHCLKEDHFSSGKEFSLSLDGLGESGDQRGTRSAFCFWE